MTPTSHTIGPDERCQSGERCVSSQPQSERIDSIDVVRGFALFGVLLSNIENFLHPPGAHPAEQGLDAAVGWFVAAFIAGKFYTLFSLLFGASFVIFLDRAMQRGDRAHRLFARRSAVLGLIGAAHALLIWYGDILVSYALIGMLLLLFVRTPPSRLWKWGIAWYGLMLLMPWFMGLGSSDDTVLRADIAHAQVVYANGTWLEVARWRTHELGYVYRHVILALAPSILGMFLIGAWFGRSGAFRQPERYRLLFRRLAACGYGIGIPMVVLPSLFEHGTTSATQLTFQSVALDTLTTVSRLALCLAYVSTIVLLLMRRSQTTGVAARAGRGLMHLAPLGRMALTNYLTHSVVFTLLLYGYGLGLSGQIGRTGATGIGIALLLGQVLFSTWWLRRFRMGPMEWVWRCLTYGRMQPLNRSASNR